MHTDPLTVYLVRHGRTPKISSDWLRGHESLDLDGPGLSEAAATATALAHPRLQQVVTSPLPRAVHTAQVIADVAGLTPVVAQAFIDRDYGWWTGHLALDVTERWGSVDAAPGVEGRDRILARTRLALDRLNHDHATGPIAVVTHHAVITTLLVHLDPTLEPVVPTGSWARLQCTSGVWQVLQVDQQAPHPLRPGTPAPGGQHPGELPTRRVG